MHAVVRLNSLLFHLAVPILAGSISSQISGNAAAAYASLTLPGFAPPAILFPIVWTLLYLLMGLSAYLITTDRTISPQERRSALLLYGLMLVINCLWSPLFFRFHLYTLSAWWCVLLVGVTALTAAVFFRIRAAAGLLYLPVLLWLVFACVLNFAVAYLN